MNMMSLMEVQINLLPFLITTLGGIERQRHELEVSYSEKAEY